MSEGLCVCLCDSPLCGRTSMGPSDGSQEGSCHGNRGCRLIPPVLSCPTILQTFLFPTVSIYLLLGFFFIKIKHVLTCFYSSFFLSFIQSFILSLILYILLFSFAHILPLPFMCCTSGGNKLESSCQDVYFCLCMCA